MEALGEAETKIGSSYCLEVTLAREAMTQALTVVTAGWAGLARVCFIQVCSLSANAILIVLKQLSGIIRMVHEAFGCMICSVVIAPVAIPGLPTPLLRIVSVDPNVINGRVKAACVILEPLPLVVVISLNKSRLVIEAPRAVKFAIPWPEPLPEVDVLFGPCNPA